MNIENEIKISVPFPELFILSLIITFSYSLGWLNGIPEWIIMLSIIIIMCYLAILSMLLIIVCTFHLIYG